MDKICLELQYPYIQHYIIIYITGTQASLVPGSCPASAATTATVTCPASTKTTAAATASHTNQCKQRQLVSPLSRSSDLNRESSWWKTGLWSRTRSWSPIMTGPRAKRRPGRSRAEQSWAVVPLMKRDRIEPKNRFRHQLSNKGRFTFDFWGPVVAGYKIKCARVLYKKRWGKSWADASHKRSIYFSELILSFWQKGF